MSAQADTTPDPSSTVLTVTIVTHDSRRYIEACLDSVLQSALPERPAVIVVDNCSTDGTVEWIRARHDWVTLVRPESRGGFARNVNLALDVATTDYVLLLNPDTELAPEALHRMVDYLNRHPSVGAVGGRLENPEGVRESSYRAYPTLWRAVCESFFLDRLAPRSRWLASRTMGYADGGRELAVDWLTGACLMVRREAYEGAAGRLDEGFRLFVEDLEWCRRLRQHGWDIRYLPEARVIHHKGSGNGFNANRYFLNCQGMVRYFKKHHGSAQAFSYQCIWVPGLLLRALVAAAQTCASCGRRGGDRLRGYARVLGAIVTGRLDRTRVAP